MLDPSLLINQTVPTAIQLANIQANLPLNEMEGKYWRCAIMDSGYVYAEYLKAAKEHPDFETIKEVCLQAAQYKYSNGYEGKRWKFTGSVWVS